MMKYTKCLGKEETLLVVAALKMIDEELRRCYWNKYQEEMNSPFSNTGESYSCDAFTVRAYNWDKNTWNFDYPEDGFVVEWYKHLGRGDLVEVPNEWNVGWLPGMLATCLKAIREDFEK